LECFTINKYRGKVMKAVSILSRRERDLALRDIRGTDRVAMVEAAKRLATAPSVLPALLKLLRVEKRVEERHAIVFALSWQNDLRTWQPLLRVLANPQESPRVRAQAAEGLAYLFFRKKKDSKGFRAAISALVAALKDPSPEVRYFAVFALGASLDRRVLPVLRKMTKDSESPKGLVGTVGEEAEEAIECIQTQKATVR
jgi:HEAT repeat protein